MPGTPAAAKEVTVSAGTELDFGRAGLTSRPPLEKPEKAGAKDASSPRAEAIKAAVAAVQIHEVSTEAEPAVLAAPLARLQMTSPFGHRISPLTGSAGELHTGTDFAEECGTEVLASGPGTVVEAGWHSGGGGNRIVVDHGDGLKTTYNHLAKIDVKVGEDTAAGRAIGAVGTTGASTGCHLHFEVVVEGQVTDPAGWLTF